MSELLGGIAELLIETALKENDDSDRKIAALIDDIPLVFTSRALYLKTILYVFYETGGMFTKEEKKAIKLRLKKDAHYYSDKELRILKDISKKQPTSRGIRQFVDRHGIHLVTLERITTKIEDVCHENKSTIRAIERLKIDLI